MNRFDSKPQSDTAKCVERRSGFTLVELLVVIAIISILVMLLLPAVQAAREAARRVTCLNSLAQLNLAAHNYEFHWESLPPGVTNPTGPIRSEPSGIHVSWMVQLLPYLEQRSAYEQFDQNLGAYAQENEPVRRMQIGSFICPSDPGIGLIEVGPTSYVGCHHDSESPIDANNNGLLYLNSHVRYADITDGSSHTILFGEAKIDADTLGWVSGTRATLRNGSSLASKQTQQTASTGPAAAATPRDALFVGGFSSFHSGGGVNMSFADGSTRFMSESIDPLLLKKLANRADGELIEQW